MSLNSSLTLVHSDFNINELNDCAIGVDASYYLGQVLDVSPAHEPLLSALSGLTGFEEHINDNLNRWDEFRVTPFFIFDGQSVTGQEEITQKRSLEANKKTDEAWTLYSESKPDHAVSTFGSNPGMLMERPEC